MMMIAGASFDNLPAVEVVAPNLIRSAVGADSWLWQGSANGVYVSALTNRDVDVQVRGFVTGRHVGAYLVDTRTATVLIHSYFAY